MRATILSLSGPPDQQADILSELSPEQAGRILNDTAPESRVTRIVEGMSSDDAANLLRSFPESRRSDILTRMASKESEGVEGLLTYSPDTAGAMMTPDVFSLSEDITVEDAIRMLRETQEAQAAETVFYAYVQNDLEQLVGVVSLRQLVVCDAWTKLGDIMERDVVTVEDNVDREEVARMVERYNFIAIPVVDEQHHLLGIITVDDVLDVLRDEATEDLLRMSGANELPERGAPILTRLPGRITRLLASALVASLIAFTAHSLFLAASASAAPELKHNFGELQGMVEQWVVFLPVMIIMSMTATMQASAVAIGAVTSDSIPSEAVWPYLTRECGVGLIMALIGGLLCGIGMGTILHFENITPLGVAVVVSMAIANILGSSIPLLFHRVRRDPTQMGGLIIMFLSATGSALGGMWVVYLW